MWLEKGSQMKDIQTSCPGFFILSSLCAHSSKFKLKKFKYNSNSNNNTITCTLTL